MRRKKPLGTNKAESARDRMHVSETIETDWEAGPAMQRLAANAAIGRKQDRE